jgi:hypothetical protein
MGHASAHLPHWMQILRLFLSGYSRSTMILPFFGFMATWWAHEQIDSQRWHVIQTSSFFVSLGIIFILEKI